MKFLSMLCICLFASSVFAARAKHANTKIARPGNDEAAIRQTCTDFDAAWNRGDAKGRALVMAENGSVINPFGQMAKGKAEVEKLFVDEMQGPLRGTQHHITPTMINFVTNNFATLDGDIKVTGMKAADGKPMAEQNSHIFLVLVKKNNQWLWLAARPYYFQKMPAAGMN